MVSPKFLLWLAAGSLALGGLWGCSDSNSGGDGGGGPALQVATCEGCHTNQAMLMATALPDTLPEDTGEG